MRKLLTATTALALVGGAAFAEMNISGSAELGLEYDSNPGEGMSKHTFAHDIGIGFSGSATTDGGLSFGASVGFDNKTGGGSFDAGKVSVSGSFGTVSIGDNDAADLVAGGIADIGLNGIGVDDKVESLRGGTAKQIRYDNSFGQISIAFSAGTKDGSDKVDAVDGYYSYMVPGDSNTSFDGITFNAANPAAARMRTVDVDVAAYNLKFDSLNSALNFSDAGLAQVGDGFDAMTGWRKLTTGENAGKVSTDGTALVTDEAQIAAFEAYESAYTVPENGIPDGSEIPHMPRPAIYTIDKHTSAEDAVGADTQYGFGMSFSASGVTVGLGYDSEKTVSAGMGFSTGDIGTNLLYVKQDGGDTGVGMDLSYTMGATKLTVAYAQGEKGDMKTDAMGLNLSHDLGGGATLVSGFGQVENDMGEAANKASMGLSFSF